MILDGLKFRKLENGWTVKYHVGDDLVGSPEQPKKGFGGEIFVQNVTELQQCVKMLINKYMNEPT